MGGRQIKIPVWWRRAVLPSLPWVVHFLSFFLGRQAAAASQNEAEESDATERTQPGADTHGDHVHVCSKYEVKHTACCAIQNTK